MSEKSNKEKVVYLIDELYRNAFDNRFGNLVVKGIIEKEDYFKVRMHSVRVRQEDLKKDVCNWVNEFLLSH